MRILNWRIAATGVCVVAQTSISHVSAFLPPMSRQGRATATPSSVNHSFAIPPASNGANRRTRQSTIASEYSKSSFKLRAAVSNGETSTPNNVQPSAPQQPPFSLST
eukprot:CAMPEP_0196155314 /NCGR_PEP_ID=MMETSP0910-20130528/40449_1 /TAXON_ID=49265 /ORGANISM="Thalassiosira rotula, Strain GSO102" /LENGTH=106 /DNA_ID=CAMNT_0041419511 /DNA_START=75 /DNA_END=392 /DNA_ORIENTATION=+